ncbi:hypothetical protein [Bacillus massilinigeriensis]|nr:hypothetical protein [Bacillus mediterraneensis]
MGIERVKNSRPENKLESAVDIFALTVDNLSRTLQGELHNRV